MLLYLICYGFAEVDWSPFVECRRRTDAMLWGTCVGMKGGRWPDHHLFTTKSLRPLDARQMQCAFLARLEYKEQKQQHQLIVRDINSRQLLEGSSDNIKSPAPTASWYAAIKLQAPSTSCYGRLCRSGRRHVKWQL